MNIYPPGISLKKQAKLKIILLTKTFSGREKLLTVKTHGIVLAQIPLSAEDKKLIILTPDMGLIEAVAKNTKSIRSKLSAACEVLAYSEFCLFKGKSGYIVNSADLENNFYHLREDLLNLSLAGYFCELTRFVMPTEDNSDEILSLLMNTLFLLQNKKRSLSFLKAVFELRLLSLSGFAPDLFECCICGCDIEEDVYFLPVEGRLICKDCLSKNPYNNTKILLPLSIKKAMEFVITADKSKIFSFKLNDEGEKFLENVSESFALYHIGGNFKSLDFYKSIKT